MAAVAEPELAGSAPGLGSCGETEAGQREDAAAAAGAFAGCDADGADGERDLDLGRDRKPFVACGEDQNLTFGVDHDVGAAGDDFPDRNGSHGEGDGCNGGISGFERREGLENGRVLCLENGHGSESGAVSDGIEQELQHGLGSVVVVVESENASQPEVHMDQKAFDVEITVEEEESYENGGHESEGNADEVLESEGKIDLVIESEGKGDEVVEDVQCGRDSESAITAGSEKEPGNDHQEAEGEVILGSITEERSVETPIADADPEDARNHSDLAGEDGGGDPSYSAAEVEINLHVTEQSGSDVEVLLSPAKACIEVAEGEVVEDGEFEKTCVGDKPDPAVEMGASLSESVIAEEVESNNAAPVIGGLDGEEQEHEVEDKQVQYESVSAQVVQEAEPKVREFVVEEAACDLPSKPDSDTGLQEEETEIIPMDSSTCSTVPVEIEKAEETVEATETVEVVALSTFESTHFESEAIVSENLQAVDANIEHTDADLQREESPTTVLMEVSTSNLIHAVTEEPEALYASEDLHAVEGNIVEEDSTSKQGEDPNPAIAEASSSESITIEVVEDYKNEIGENNVKDRDFVVDISLAKPRHELEASNEIRECKNEGAVSEGSSIGKLEEKAPLSDSGTAEGTMGPSDDISPSSGERIDASVQRRRQAWIVRYPRNVDDEIQRARSQLDEKTQIRDSMNADIHKLRTSVDECRIDLEDKKAKERDAEDRLRTKRQERRSVLAMLDRIRNATSADDISEQIQRLEHMMQHETMPLKQEKQCMAEIKRLKQQLDELRYRMDPNMDAQVAFDKKAEMEQCLKDLKKDLDALSAGVSQAEHNKKIAMDKYDKENKIFNEMKDKRTKADDSRQKVYEELTKLKNLKKHYSTCRKDKQTALYLEAAYDKEELLLHCQNQVEKFMEMWNNDDEFRLQYIKSNMPSTVRRFMTLDGRSLGPDEEPIVLSRRTVEKVMSNMASSSSEADDDAASVFPAVDAKDGNLDPVIVLEGKKNAVAPSDVAQRDLPPNVKKVTTRAAPPSEAAATKRVPIEEVGVVAKKLTKEEEDIARKAEEQARIEEESRKEKLAAESKELHRLEQKAKAKEAEERKRRQAEKAKAKAEYKAQKEAELKEKEKAKKEMKKKKKAASTDTPEADCLPPTESTQPPQPSQKPDAAKATRKLPRQPPTAPTKKYNKEVRPLPLPLRSRNKRRTSAWIWVAVALAMVVSALFLVRFHSVYSLF